MSTTPSPTWIVPFKGRNSTGPTDLNFLWKSGNVYVMDNHRAAGWCWAQEITAGVKHGLFHIDRHPDAFENDLKQCVDSLPQGVPGNIDDYLTVSWVPTTGPSRDPIFVFRWDTYLPIHLALNPGRVSPVFFATHREEQLPTAVTVTEIETGELLRAVEDEVEAHPIPWIMNVDLDYFFRTDGDNCVRFLGDDYLDRLSEAINRLNQAGKLTIITIALTATEGLTNGWPEVEAMAERMCAILGHTFKIP